MPTILIIDDDESIRAGLRLLLADRGYAVECASDGARGVALLHHIHPDVVITRRTRSPSASRLARTVTPHGHPGLARALHR